ncbi:hypothetical protein L596_022574 [Steinernema carpocapsae]|uniref:Uncharacterized protein n=1 Tax=Steinernema carpocapsae TaxID=34508 RepID=A0A4U5MM37_STECR|nr:hypothetical protein L596_022574 [Steinernema carpocapsae]
MSYVRRDKKGYTVNPLPPGFNVWKSHQDEEQLIEVPGSSIDDTIVEEVVSPPPYPNTVVETSFATDVCCVGPPGDPGFDGIDGEEGFPGDDYQDQEECQICPQGPPGKPGLQGLRGAVRAEALVLQA